MNTRHSGPLPDICVYTFITKEGLKYKFLTRSKEETDARGDKTQFKYISRCLDILRQVDCDVCIV